MSQPIQLDQVDSAGAALVERVESTQSFYATGTFSRGDAISIDLGTTTHGAGDHAKRSATADDPLFVGIALNDGVAGDIVQVAGPGSVVALSNVATSIAAGGPLQTSTTAGRFEAAGAATQRLQAVALTAESGNTATVRVLGG